jgi:hypothetical protein
LLNHYDGDRKQALPSLLETARLGKMEKIKRGEHLMIYQKPVFINSVAHRSMKVAPVKNFEFTRGLNSILLLGQEFLEAAKFYPVVFTKSANDEVIPVALLGLRNNENLFVTKEGAWKEGMYVPAFFRRYPFILANNVGQDGSFAVCVDSAYEGVNTDEGMALFNEEGEQTKEFTATIEFLRNYQAQFENTKGLIKLLQEYGLFKDVSANITLPAGEKLGFAGLMMVDEEAIFKLDDEKIVRLVRVGYMGWIYAHLYSLSNFRTLMALA